VEVVLIGEGAHRWRARRWWRSTAQGIELTGGAEDAVVVEVHCAGDRTHWWS